MAKEPACDDTVSLAHCVYIVFSFARLNGAQFSVIALHEPACLPLDVQGSSSPKRVLTEGATQLDLGIALGDQVY